MLTGRTLIIVVCGLAMVLATATGARAVRNRRSSVSEIRREVDLAVGAYGDLIRRHPEWIEAVYDQRLQGYREMSPIRQGRHLSRFQQELGQFRGEMILRTGGDDTYRSFSPNGFRDFYDSFSYPDVQDPSVPPLILGDEDADRAIRRLAESRGYRLRAAASETALVSRGRHRLQAPVWEAWDDLKTSAEKDGITLDLVSAYRSPDRQREIFLGRVRADAEEALGRSFTATDITSGALDIVLDTILATSSVPGYSKHHTGYTIDITDMAAGIPFTEFGRTPGFLWMSADNYHNAKRFGFIPSYPQGASKLGPDPEPWEYVWVGKQATTDLIVQ